MAAQGPEEVGMLSLTGVPEAESGSEAAHTPSAVRLPPLALPPRPT